MSPSKIRAALSRPPVFGDVDQIQALKALRAIDEEHEGKNEYKVRVEWSGEETVTVWAEDEKEARERAIEMIDVDDMDIEYTVVRMSL